MNRRPPVSFSLTKATPGFLQYKAAEGLSPNTLQGYQRDLKLWCEYTGDIPVSQITMRRATAKRDQAIILTLLDTGLRASELSALQVGDVDLKTGKVQVKHGRLGGAKGGKGRIVFLGKAARRAVWRYLAERTDGDDPEAPLFLVKYDRPMNKNALRPLMSHLGEKAGCLGTVPWIWSNTTRASRRSMSRKHTGAPARLTIGDSKLTSS